MIEGPLSGKAESDSASAADLIALTATVAGNTSGLTAKAPTTVVDALATEVSTKASGSGLIAAETAITTHTHTHRTDCQPQHVGECNWQ